MHFRRSILIVLLAVTLAGGLFAAPQPARAQFAGIVTVVADVQRTVMEIINKALKTVVAVAYKSGLQLFLNRVAYDTATYLATGGEGGKPGFITQGWGPYLTQVGDEALGEFLTTGVDVAIEEFAAPVPPECAQYCVGDAWSVSADNVPSCNAYKPPEAESLDKFVQCMQQASRLSGVAARQKVYEFTKAKLNICAPITADISARIQLTARNILEPPKPRCTFSQIRKSLPQSTIRINGVDVRNPDFTKMQLRDLPSFVAYFNPSENDIGATMQIIAEGYRVQEQAKVAKSEERQENKGYTGVTDFLTGEIKTPADLKAEAVKEATTRQSYSTYLTFTGDVVADSIKTFTNTLVSKMLERILKKGFNPRVDRSLGSFGPSSGAFGFTRGAQLAFADILQADISSDGPGILLADLASCPPQSSVGGPEPENCTITSQFSRAVEEQLTLYEATRNPNEADRPCPRCQRLINPQSVFGFKDGGINQPTLNEGIPYSSIVILRKHRIVPVGWELAALYISRFSKTQMTLGQLMDAYDSCTPGTDTYPFCRLVDPNWVLKAPVSRCNRQGPGEENTAALTTPLCDTDTNGDGVIACPPLGEDVATTPIERRTYCADQRSCILEGGSEGCRAYGYCMQEKEVWDVDADTCDPWHVSCQQYQNIGSGATAAYLKNTTNSGGCTRVASLGCRRYARSPDPATGGWLDSAAAADNYYLNRQAENTSQVCKSGSAAGCTEFLRVLNTSIEPARPLAVTEYQSLVGSAAASGYSGAGREVSSLYLNGSRRMCTAAFVGCALYTPEDPSGGGVGIPAMPTFATTDASGNVTNWGDECPAVCVGYATFEQLATNFEAGIGISPGVNFIPSTARQCPAQDAGCDEFTNLDVVARGGEGKEYYTELRACQPSGGPGVTEATYYTWQGSDTTGYQLKVWTFVPVTTPDANNPVIGAPLVSGPKDSRVDGTKTPPWDGIDCKEDFNSSFPDPDCREFVDVNLNYYYRYMSKIMLVSDECHQLRRTLGGTYYAIASLSKSCAASSAGCREYRGSTATSATNLFLDTFEGGSYSPWQGTGLTVSTESATRNNHSLKIPTMASRPISLAANTPYAFLLWAKGTTASDVAVRVLDGSNAILQTFTFAVGVDWSNFSIGPIVNPAGGATSLQLQFDTATGFIDNVTLRPANLYAIKNSWATPAVCDQPSPGYHLGCAAYASSIGERFAFRQFSNLCPDAYVGCEALINTQNSSSPAAQTFYSGTPSAITVPADAVEYVIPEQGARCEQSEKACTIIGQASLRSDGSTAFREMAIKVEPDTFGDTATTPLSGGTQSNCTVEEEYCTDWRHADQVAAQAIFKDPTGYTCEYATKNGVSTWYQTGTNTFCQNATSGTTLTWTAHCIGGRSKTDTVGNSCTTNANCVDYARPGSDGICSTATAVCPGGQSTCTEYQDPQLPEGCAKHLLYGQKACSNNPVQVCKADAECGGIGNYCDVPACDMLFVPKNNIQDAIAACNGAFDPAIGCVGLHEVGGVDDYIITSKHCSLDAGRTCLSDIDCAGVGTCGY